MDIYTAQKAINRLHAYILSIHDDPPRMYGKTRHRLFDILDSSAKVVELIRDLLEEERLSDDEGLTVSEEDCIELKLEAMRADLDGIGQFVSSGKLVLESFSINPKPLLTADQKRQTVKLYRDLLFSASKVTTGYKITDELVFLLNDWFVARIDTVYDQAEPFKYSVSRFRNIIYAFVIEYSYCFSNGTLDAFYEKYDSWKSSLPVSLNSHRHIAPYAIYSMVENLDADKLTLHAAVVWDILSSTVFSIMCEQKMNYLPLPLLDDDLIYKVTSSLKSSVLDPHVPYQVDPSILVKLGIE